MILKKEGSRKSNQINILDLRDSPWVDGPGRTILDCAQSIEGENMHFIIGSFSGGADNNNAYAEEAKRRGLTVLEIPEKSSFDLGVVPFILQAIKNHKIDLIHAHDFRSDVFGLICAKRCGIPVISTVHGWIENDIKGRIYTLIDKVLLRFFDHILVVSARTQRKLVNAFIPKKKMTVVTNALILDPYKLNKEQHIFRKEIGASKDTVLISNIGRLSPEKGQYEFLLAAREILKSYNNVLFILIGVGPDEEKLRDFVKQSKMDDFVVFLGFRKDMISIYNNLDLVVQSSYTEGMPNIVLEALLMAVPVIATDVGGTAEIITHKNNGILIKPGSISNLVSEINRFFETADRYKTMAEQGRSDIKKYFDHNLRVEKIRNIYNQVIVSK